MFANMVWGKLLFIVRNGSEQYNIRKEINMLAIVATLKYY
jgi:hypothetical protein